MKIRELYLNLCVHSRKHVIDSSDSNLKELLEKIRTPKNELDTHVCRKSESITRYCYKQTIDFFWRIDNNGKYRGMYVIKDPGVLLLPSNSDMNDIEPENYDLICLLSSRVAKSRSKFGIGTRNLKKYIRTYEKNKEEKIWNFKNLYTREMYVSNMKKVLEEYPYIYYPIVSIKLYLGRYYKYGIVSSYPEEIKDIKMVTGLKNIRGPACVKLYHAVMLYIDNEEDNIHDIINSVFKPYLCNLNIGDFLCECRTISEIDYQ